VAEGAIPVPSAVPVPPDPETDVEPIGGLSALDAGRAAFLPPVQFGKDKPDKATRRENVRTVVAYSVVGITLLLGLALTGAYFAGAVNVKLAIGGVFTPFLGVAGVIIGFYFGGKDSTN
jgi:hypothetical protein